MAAIRLSIQIVLRKVQLHLSDIWVFYERREHLQRHRIELRDPHISRDRCKIYAAEKTCHSRERYKAIESRFVKLPD